MTEIEKMTMEEIREYVEYVTRKHRMVLIW